MRALWNDTVIAESDDTVVVEGNHYFPSASANPAYLVESDTTTICPWKGEAHYYSLTVDGAANRDAAWYYPQPAAGAKKLCGPVGFSRGGKVVTADRETGANGSSAPLLGHLLAGLRRAA